MTWLSPRGRRDTTVLMSDEVLLFAYGSLLPGERDHELLAGATHIGAVRTKPGYKLVDLGVYPALLVGGDVSVAGELYRIDKKHRFNIDVRKECPVLFHRTTVTLEDGSEAEAYVMHEEQVRGKRRIAIGDWRRRFEPRPRVDQAGALTRWARNRF
jgi:gamma-glutamylcyclotransferase (GGCT)/AIG2-like uncharacterized protein YtfP